MICTIQPLFERLAQQYPVVTLVGPRQSGKTTLARGLFPAKPCLTLEDPDQRKFARADPRGFLAALPGRFILTGSQRFELMQGVTQSQAGRTGVLRLWPFTAAEAAVAAPERRAVRELRRHGGDQGPPQTTSRACAALPPSTRRRWRAAVSSTAWSWRTLMDGPR